MDGSQPETGCAYLAADRSQRRGGWLDAKNILARNAYFGIGHNAYMTGYPYAEAVRYVPDIQRCKVIHEGDNLIAFPVSSDHTVGQNGDGGQPGIVPASKHIPGQGYIPAPGKAEAIRKINQQVITHCPIRAY